jgi:hypothetical protein
MQASQGQSDNMNLNSPINQSNFLPPTHEQNARNHKPPSPKSPSSAEDDFNTFICAGGLPTQSLERNDKSTNRDYPQQLKDYESSFYKLTIETAQSQKDNDNLQQGIIKLGLNTHYQIELKLNLEQLAQINKSQNKLQSNLKIPTIKQIVTNIQMLLVSNAMEYENKMKLMLNDEIVDRDM